MCRLYVKFASYDASYFSWYKWPYCINRFGHSKVFVITARILIFKVSIMALKEKSLPKSHLAVLPFSVYRVKVKRQKEKCQFFCLFDF